METLESKNKIRLKIINTNCEETNLEIEKTEQIKNLIKLYCKIKGISYNDGLYLTKIDLNKIGMKHGKRNVNKKNILGKKQEKLPLILRKVYNPNSKPLEEWIYGKLNRVGSSDTITFKNQKAFNGYDGKKVDLCKLII